MRTYGTTVNKQWQRRNLTDNFVDLDLTLRYDLRILLVLLDTRDSTNPRTRTTVAY